MKNDNYRNILKLNGFKRQGNKYNRDDGLQIEFTNLEHNLVYPDGTVIYCETKEQLIGELVLCNIINRLFF